MGKILQQLCTSSKVALTSPRLVIRLLFNWITSGGAFPVHLKMYAQTGLFSGITGRLVRGRPLKVRWFCKALSKDLHNFWERKKCIKNKPIFTFDWQIKSLASLSTPGSFSGFSARYIHLFPIGLSVPTWQPLHRRRGSRGRGGGVAEPPPSAEPRYLPLEAWNERMKQS